MAEQIANGHFAEDFVGKRKRAVVDELHRESRRAQRFRQRREIEDRRRRTDTTLKSLRSALDDDEMRVWENAIGRISQQKIYCDHRSSSSIASSAFTWS